MKACRIYSTAVVISFALIALLCILFQQPLIFSPIKYGLIDFLSLFLLMAILNVGLVFLILEPLRFLNRKLIYISKPIIRFAYFGLISLTALFFTSLLFGSVESPHGYPFYYYNFSNNSWIYLVSAAITVLLASFLYARNQVEIHTANSERFFTTRNAEIVWRALNLMVFAAAFVGPWGTIFGDIVYGVHMVGVSFSFFVQWAFGSDIPGFWASFGLYYCFGWIWLGAYWFVNGVRALGKNKAWRKHWFSIPLVISTAFLLFDMFPRIFRDHYNRFWWPSLYWGYWLLLLSIGSSIVLETVGYLADRTRKREATV